MENLFFAVLGMSGTAAIVILVVLLARLALRKAPTVFSYALWAVVLFRLLCPITIHSVFSLIPAAQVADVPGRGSVPAQVVQVQTGLPAVDRQVNDFFVRHPYQGQPALPEDDLAVPAPPIQQTGPAADWRTVPAAVWLVGMAALLGYGAASLLRLRRKLVGSVPLAGEKAVRLADHIPSPFVLGVFRPTIYLPSDLRPEERDYILLHERTHIRRGDHIFRVLAWLALAVHWFNPLVWLAFRLAGKDMEMSCDEAVLGRMGRDIRADYCSSLLRISAGGKLPAGPLAFGEDEPRGRIKNVLSYKRPAMWVVVIALAAVVCAGVALATSRTADTPGADLDGLTADLSLSLDETGNQTVVRMEGSVGDVTLVRGASWYPDAVWSEHPLGELSMVYPAFTQEIEGHIAAWWADEGRTSVTVSTRITAMLSSYLPTGYWTFTVDLTKNGGVVTEMTANGLTHIIDDENAEIRMYPTSISDEEAVKAARVAAKLLTAAEEFYAGAQAGGPTQSGFIPAYSLAEGDGSGSVHVTGLGNAYVEWSLDTSPSKGQLYFAKDPAFCCPRLAGEAAEGCAIWTDENRSAVSVVMNVNDERAEGGTITGFYVHFVVELESGTVTKRVFESDVEGETLELTDREMADMARTLAGLLKGAEEFYAGARPPVSFTPIEMNPAYSRDELGIQVKIIGLDCESARWYSRQANAAYYVPEKALGHLEILEPQFLGEAFNSAYNGLDAQYSPEEDPNLVWLHLYPRDSGKEPANCSVNLATGEVIDHEIPGFETAGVTVPDSEMVAAAYAVAQLIEDASYYYAASAPAPEEGPLPFETPMKLWFGSGAGGWNTILTLHPDGSFEGDYSDADMTIQYVCTFHGRFGDIRQVTGASYSMTLEELVLDTGRPIGEEWNAGGIHYISSGPYGFDGWDGEGLEPGAQFFFYTPEASGKRGGELYGMENESSDLYQFWTWWPDRYAISGGSGGTLNCYGLRSVETGRGFFDLGAWGLL